MIVLIKSWKFWVGLALISIWLLALVLRITLGETSIKSAYVVLGFCLVFLYFEYFARDFYTKDQPDLPTQKSGYFSALTGLRAVAAYMVFVHHYELPSGFLGNTLTAMSRELYIGVAVFFVLSGFLIYYRYSKSAALNKQFYGGYLVNRIARIYPMYFLVVTADTIYRHFATGINLRDSIVAFLVQITFIRGFFDGIRLTGVVQGWTLTVEEVFYFGFPLLLLMIKRSGFFKALLGVYIAGVVLLIIGGYLQLFGFFYPFFFVVNYTFFGRAGEFFLGMLLADCIIKNRLAFIPKLKTPLFTYLGMLGISLNLLILAHLVTPEYPYGQLNPLGPIFNNIFMPIFIVILIGGLVLEDSLVKRFLANPVMELLGKSSYTFYLIHLGSIAILIFNYLPQPLTQTITGKFVVLNIAAVILFTLLETPLQKLVKRLFHKPAAALIAERQPA